MHPRAFGHADAFLDDVDEGGGVVVGDLFTLVDRRDEAGVDHRAPRAQRSGIGARQNSEFSECVGGEEFDFEHRVKARLVAEELRDVLRGVSRYHVSPWLAARAMSLRRTLPLKVMSPAPS